MVSLGRRALLLVPGLRRTYFWPGSGVRLGLAVRLPLGDAFWAVVRDLLESAFLLAVRLRFEVGFFTLLAVVVAGVVFLAVRRRGLLAFFALDAD